MRMNRTGLSSRTMGWMAVYGQWGWSLADQLYHSRTTSRVFDGALAKYSDGVMVRQEKDPDYHTLAHFNEMGTKVVFELWDCYGRLVDEYERDLPRLYVSDNS